MKRTIPFLLIFSILLVSCANNTNKEPKTLSEKEKELITEFADKLKESINNYEYDLVNESWDNSLFIKRVGQLTETEKVILEHSFEDDFAKYLQFINSGIVNRLKFNQGEIILSDVRHFDEFSEVTYTLLHDNIIDFFRYRIEIKDNQPRLSDIYWFKEDLWESNKYRNTIKFNAKYTGSSEERRQANKALQTLEQLLVQRDTLAALGFLYEFPEVPIPASRLSMQKINLSSELGDSIYASVLEREFRANNNLFVAYLYHYYFEDSLGLEKVFSSLSESTHESALVDSLRSGTFFWY